MGWRRSTTTWMARALVSLCLVATTACCHKPAVKPTVITLDANMKPLPLPNSACRLTSDGTPPTKCYAVTGDYLKYVVVKLANRNRRIKLLELRLEACK